MTTIFDYLGAALATGILIVAYESYPLKSRADARSACSLLFFAETESASQISISRPRGWLFFFVSLVLQCPALLAYAPVSPSSSRGSVLRLRPLPALGIIILRIVFVLSFVSVTVWAWSGHGFMNLASLFRAQAWLLTWVVNYCESIDDE